MAEPMRFSYMLTPNESTRWQQGGEAAQRLQQELAEVHRQGGLGFVPLLDVLHPDGILAAQFAAPVTASPPPMAPNASQSQDLTRQAPVVAQVSRSLEGQVASRVTGYHMSAAESADWVQGGQSTHDVTSSIATRLQEVAGGRGVPVYLDDGRWAYTHGSTLGRTLQAELGTVLPVATMAATVRHLGKRLASLTQGVDVHVGVSIGRGASPRTLQASVEELGRRVDQLTRALPQQTREQGMSY